MKIKIVEICFCSLVLMMFVGCASSATKIEGPLEVKTPEISTSYEFFVTKETEIELDDELAEVEQRKRRVQALEKLVSTAADKYQKSNFVLNLANEQYEYAIALKKQAQEELVNKSIAYKIGESLTQPTIDLSSYNDALMKHINLLRTFTNEYPTDLRRREAFLGMAISMSDLGHELTGNYFGEVSKGLEDKEDIYRYQIAKADWFVKQKNWEQAKSLYSEVMKSIPEKKHSVNAYASYRLGHVFLAMKDVEKAEVAFKVAFLTDTEEERRFNVKAEAALALAKLWAVAGKKSEAETFAMKYKPESFMADYHEFYVQAVMTKGEYRKAIAELESQIKANPTSTGVPMLRLEIALAYLKDADTQKFDQELKNMEQLITDKQLPWYKEHGENQVYIDFINKVKKHLPSSAGFKLVDAGLVEQDVKKKEHYLSAGVKLLTAILPSKKEDSDRVMIHMALLRANYKLNRSKDVLDQMDKLLAIKGHPDVNKNELVLERLKVIIEMDQVATYPGLPELGQVSKPIALPDLKQRFVRAVDDYLKLVPDSENKGNLQYQVANTWFQYGHYPKALAMMEEIAVEFPRSEEGQACIQTMVSMAGQSKNYEEVIRLTTNLLNNRKVKGRAIRNFLKESLDWAKAQPDVLAH